MEKRLEELIEKTGTCLSINEGLELLNLVYKFALGKEPDLELKTLEDITKDLKEALVKGLEKEKADVIQTLIDLMEGKGYDGENG